MLSKIKTLLQKAWDQNFHQRRINWPILLAAAAIGLVFLVFGVDLFRADAGQVTGAFGSLIGGIIGAGGAVWAVHLTIARQRNEEIERVGDAVRTEITAFVKYVIGAVEICQQIKAGLKIPRQDARYIAKNFWGDPIIYPAVADRVGLLPHPQATTEFYMRLSEVRGMLEALRTKTDPQSFINVQAPPEHVTPDFAASIADSLVTALQLARPIVASDGDSSAKSQLAAWVQTTVVGQIDECLKSTKESFPSAGSFKTPPSRS